MKKIFLSLFVFTPLFFYFPLNSAKASPTASPETKEDSNGVMPKADADQGLAPVNDGAPAESTPSPSVPSNAPTNEQQPESIPPTSSSVDKLPLVLQPTNEIFEDPVASNNPPESSNNSLVISSTQDALSQSPDEPIASPPAPEQPPVAQAPDRGRAPATASEPRPRRSRQQVGALEIRLPQEVVQLSQQQDYQVARGISEAIEKAIVEGDISPEEIALSEEDEEKLVYKVELEDISFLCGEEGEVPATVAKLKGQDELIVVLWDSDYFDKAGYDPQTRCQQASARFADFAEKNLFVYMTSGKLNEQPVICLTSSEEGDCGDGISVHEGLLFTLKPNDDPDKKLKQLASIFQPESSASSEDSTKQEDKEPVSEGKPLEE